MLEIMLQGNKASISTQNKMALPANISNNCGEDEHTTHQVHRDEGVFHILLRTGHFADCCQNESGPVKAENYIATTLNSNNAKCL